MVALTRSKQAAARRENNEKETRKMMMLAGVFGLVAFTIIGAVGYSLIATSLRENVTQEGIHALDYAAFSQSRALLQDATRRGDRVGAEFLAWLSASGGYYQEAADAASRAVELGGHGGYEVLGDMALLGFGRVKGPVAALSYFKQGAFKIADEQAAHLAAGEGGVLPGHSSSQDFSVAALTRYHDKDGDGLLNENEKLDLTRNLYANMIRRAIPLLDNETDYTSMMLEADRSGIRFIDLMLGDMIFLGNDRVTSNAQRALEYWNRSMENGNPGAVTRLAGAYWHGYAAQRDPRTAIDLYKTAANKNKDPVAMYALGLISIRMAADPAQASSKASLLNSGLGYLSKAAAAGYGPASTALGVLSLTESDEAQSVRKAVEWLKIAAVEQQDVSGRILFDLLQITGTGVPLDFAAGFDDLVRLSETLPVAEAVLELLQRREDPALVLYQALTMANRVLQGEYAYREGDPNAAQSVADPVTGEMIPRPFPYYNSVEEMMPGLRNLYGANNYPSVNNAEEYTLKGMPLLSPALAEIIVQFNPSTGASRFVPHQMMPRPLPPSVPRHYSISDFVPPVELIEPKPLRDDRGDYTKLF